MKMASEVAVMPLKKQDLFVKIEQSSKTNQFLVCGI
jgi:hypothetical protein